MSDIKYPKYKEDVLVVINTDCGGRLQAKRLGYKWYTYDRYKEELYSVDPRRALHDFKDCVLYDTLPSKGVNVSFQERVLEFALSPQRSNSNQLIQLLTTHEFFGKVELEQCKIIEDILKTSAFCDDGKRRFREHMGDLLPKTKRFVYTIEVDTEFDVSGDAISSDVQNAFKSRFKESKWQSSTAKFISKREAN